MPKRSCNSRPVQHIPSATKRGAPLFVLKTQFLRWVSRLFAPMAPILRRPSTVCNKAILLDSIDLSICEVRA